MSPSGGRGPRISKPIERRRPREEAVIIPAPQEMLPENLSLEEVSPVSALRERLTETVRVVEERSPSTREALAPQIPETSSPDTLKDTAQGVHRETKERKRVVRTKKIEPATAPTEITPVVITSEPIIAPNTESPIEHVALEDGKAGTEAPVEKVTRRKQAKYASYKEWKDTSKKEAPTESVAPQKIKKERKPRTKIEHTPQTLNKKTLEAWDAFAGKKQGEGKERAPWKPGEPLTPELQKFREAMLKADKERGIVLAEKLPKTWGEQYRTLPFHKKLLLSGGLLGPSVMGNSKESTTGIIGTAAYTASRLLSGIGRLTGMRTWFKTKDKAPVWADKKSMRVGSYELTRGDLATATNTLAAMLLFLKIDHTIGPATAAEKVSAPTEVVDTYIAPKNHKFLSPVEVAKDGAVWGVLEEQLSKNESFAELTKAQKDFVLDHVQKAMRALPETERIHMGFGTGTIDLLKGGEKLDLTHVPERIVERGIAIAKELSPLQMKSILRHSIKR